MSQVQVGSLKAYVGKRIRFTPNPGLQVEAEVAGVRELDSETMEISFRDAQGKLGGQTQNMGEGKAPMPKTFEVQVLS